MSAKVTREIFFYFTYPIDVNVTLHTFKLKMAVKYERRVHLNLFAACICYIVASSSVETTSRSFVIVGNSFSDLLRIQSS